MIYLREVREDELELTMAWRSNPLVYEGFYTQDAPLKWKEHFSWWKSRKNWKNLMVVMVNNHIERRIGVVTLGQLDHWSPEIGYYIGEVSLWKKGYGTEAVKLGLAYLKDNGYKYCHSTVLTQNIPSAHLLWKLGFQAGGGAREGEIWLTKKL
jgi:RimJ/RimL family protein N-acetyltransferase